MFAQLRIAFSMTVVLVIITGLIYPLAVTGAAQILFKDRADGSVIERDGVIVGSKYIGQAFTEDRYFRGRISAAGTTENNPNGYDPMASGASNLGPTNQVLIDRVQAASVPAGVVATGADLFTDVHLRERGYLLTIDHPDTGPLVHPGMTVRLAATPGRVRRPVPVLGAHNEDVFCGELGLSTREYRELVAQGVIA